MKLTLFETIAIPGAGGDDTPPVAVARGYEVPVRVLIRNTGATPLFFAGADQNVITAEGPSSKTFRLEAGSPDVVFVLAPEQVLYAVGNVAGGSCSVTVSEALPLL